MGKVQRTMGVTLRLPGRVPRLREIARPLHAAKVILGDRAEGAPRPPRSSLIPSDLTFG